MIVAATSSANKCERGPGWSFISVGRCSRPTDYYCDALRLGQNICDHESAATHRATKRICVFSAATRFLASAVSAKMGAIEKRRRPEKICIRVKLIHSQSTRTHVRWRPSPSLIEGKLHLTKRPVPPVGPFFLTAINPQSFLHDDLLSRNTAEAF
jgi:hypothetical protein